MILLMLPAARFATKSVFWSGWQTTLIGSLGDRARLVLTRATRLPWPSRTLKMETEPSSLLTMASVESSSDRSIAVERLERSSTVPSGGAIGTHVVQSDAQAKPASQPLFGPLPGQT